MSFPLIQERTCKESDRVFKGNEKEIHKIYIEDRRNFIKMKDRNK